MPAPKITQASVRNAIAAATAHGLSPSAIVVHGDGSVRLEFFAPKLDGAANSVKHPEQSLPKKWRG